MSNVKELKVRRNPAMQTIFELYYEGGGELPKELSGKYTSAGEAITAANTYLATREKVRPRRVENKKG